MKAFILDRYGRHVALRLGEIAGPVVREEDVLVQTPRGGVNLLDSKLRSGQFKLILPYHVPSVLAHDGGSRASRRRAREALQAW
jgi:alcohol dehydrogenase